MHPDVVKLQLLDIKTFRYDANGKWYAYSGAGIWPGSIDVVFLRHSGGEGSLIIASTEEELARLVLEEITNAS